MTHTAREQYAYTSWRDCSGSGYREWAHLTIVRLTMTKRLVFADSHTREEYTHRKQDFVARNTRDTHQSFSLLVDMPSYKQKMMLDRDPARRPELMSIHWYWVACALCLSYPFRVWLTIISENHCWREAHLCLHQGDSHGGQLHTARRSRRRTHHVRHARRRSIRAASAAGHGGGFARRRSDRSYVGTPVDACEPPMGFPVNGKGAPV